MRMGTLCLLAVLLAACGDSSAGTTTTSVPDVSTTSVPDRSTTIGVTPTTASELSGTTSVTTAAPTTTTARYDVVVEGQDPDFEVIGPAEFGFHLGDVVHITVVTSVDDEVHVHGYDLKFDARAGVPLPIEFPADVEGIFEVEMESAGLHLFDIRVDP